MSHVRCQHLGALCWLQFCQVGAPRPGSICGVAQLVERISLHGEGPKHASGQGSRGFEPHHCNFAGVTQLAEYHLPKVNVVGSIPITRSNFSTNSHGMPVQSTATQSSGFIPYWLI